MDKAKAYQKEREILQLVELFLTPAVLALTLLSPLSQAFKNWALQLAGKNAPLEVAAYFFFFSVWLLVFDVPVSFYSGYHLEKKYDLSNHTLKSWTGDLLKKSTLSFLLSLLLIEALYALIRHFELWWVYAWAGFAFVSYILGKLFPVLIVPIFYKYGPVADETLKKRILDLAARYQMPVENVYSLNLSRTTKKANAAFMGMGKTKRVVLSDTLLENFNGDEIETVVAHELGHFKHGDIWKQLIVGTVISFIGFWMISRLMPVLTARLGMEGVADIAGLPLIFLLFSLFFMILMPLQNGFSRWIERAADRFALEAFPNVEAFISCMDKLGKVNLADPEPNPVVEWFFYDHPSIGRRIAMAKSYVPKDKS